MKKVFKSMLFVAMSLIVAVGLTACSEDEVKPKDKTKELVGPQPAKVVIDVYEGISVVEKVVRRDTFTVTPPFTRTRCTMV